jgi:hypothetical protein
MDKMGKNKTVSVIDSVMAIFIFIIGALIVFFGISFMDFVTQVSSGSYYGTANPYAWLTKIPWIINFIGFTIIIYGIKRLLDNIL